MVRKFAWLGLVLVAVVGVGCSGPTGSGSNPGKDGTELNPAAAAEGKKYLLDKEPAGAKGVLETRKQATNGDDVVLVGRIAGSEKPFVAGRASFSVTDLTIKPCADGEGCKTPWDCCCVPNDELLPAMAQVKFEGGDKKTLGFDAKEMFGIKELAVVVVKGKASRDEQGNLTVVASGIHVRQSKE